MTQLKPEHRSRIDKQTGKRLVYLCEDRSGNGTVVVCPKLTALAEYLSAGAQMRQDKVSVSSLYNILFIRDGEGRTGGWSKHRFRVRAVPLESAVDAFEAMRRSGAYEQAVVLGSERCTVVQPV